VADNSQGSLKILRRLDRCYAQSKSITNKLEVSSRIVGGYCLSDHHPILAVCQDSAERKFPSRYKMNISVLKNKRRKKLLRELLLREVAFLKARNLEAERILDLLFKRATNQTRSWGKHGAQKRHEQEKELRSELEVAQLELEQDMDSSLLYEIWNEKRQAVKELEVKSAKWVTNHIQKMNIQASQFGNKHIFLSFKKIAKALEMNGIEDENGQVHTDWAKMEELTVVYFEKLFGSENNADEVEIDRFLDKVNLSLADEDREFIGADFTVAELLECVKELGKNNSRGPHGVPAKLYLEYWDIVGDLLVETLNKGIAVGQFSKRFLKGLITLLHKKGNHCLLKNKRGISLTKVAYKIGTKAMQRRMMVVLNKLILHEQDSYLPGQSIHHGMLLSNKMVDRARHMQKAFVTLKVDIIKAFDKVEWRFVTKLMRKMGFPKSSIKFFHAITGNANAMELINGRPTREVKITRSIRQGCPAAPLFFILVLEPLNCAIREALENGTLKGICFEEVDVQVAHQFYSDNTSVMIEATVENDVHARRSLMTLAKSRV
jgi:hypothetical protein